MSRVFGPQQRVVTSPAWRSVVARRDSAWHAQQVLNERRRRANALLLLPPRVVLAAGPAAVVVAEPLAFVETHPGSSWHLAADHHDEVQVATEWLVVLVVVVVAGVLVVNRLVWVLPADSEG
jgi:hypothetical protein